MAYTRHDINNTAADPQPASTTVNRFSGNEGWATVLIKTLMVIMRHMIIKMLIELLELIRQEIMTTQPELLERTNVMIMITIVYPHK